MKAGKVTKKKKSQKVAPRTQPKVVVLDRPKQWEDDLGLSWQQLTGVLGRLNAAVTTILVEMANEENEDARLEVFVPAEKLDAHLKKALLAIATTVRVPGSEG